MIFHWYPYHMLTVMLMLISGFLAGYVFTHRQKAGTWYPLGILSLVLLWCTAQGLEFSVQGLGPKLFFANLQYLSITGIPVLYLFLSLSVSGKDALLRRRVLPYLFLILPFILNILLWTDPWHGWIRQDVRLDMSGVLPVISKRFGTAMLPFAIYNFAVSVASLVVLLRTWINKRSFYRDQAAYLFIGFLIPTLSTFLHFIGVNFTKIDTTPATFAITGILLTYGIFRHGLFDLVPVALGHVFKEMKPGLIVYDRSLRLIDINPSAREILNTGGRRIIGLPVSSAFSHVPELVEVIGQRASCKKEISCMDGETGCFFEVTVTQLEDEKGNGAGWMAQIYDVSDRKAEEERLRQDKDVAMQLYKTAEEISISNESAFLQAQIKPHFLYNALNVIAALSRLDPEKSRELILDLSSYMHHSFDFKNLAKYIAFEEELEFIQAYVRIEQARFRDAINMVYEVDDTEGLLLPPLLLQPLVENAIRHGIRKNDAGSTVVLRVKSLEDAYRIEVEDDGAGMTAEKLEAVLSDQGAAGVGLANIRRRLKMLYDTQLLIESRPGAGTKVTMTLPKRGQATEL